MGFERGGVSRFGLVSVLICPFLSFLGLSRFFSGIFRFVLFLFLGLFKHLQGTFPKGSAAKAFGQDIAETSQRPRAGRCWDITAPYPERTKCRDFAAIEIF